MLAIWLRQWCLDAGIKNFKELATMLGVAPSCPSNWCRRDHAIPMPILLSMHGIHPVDITGYFEIQVARHYTLWATQN